MLHDVMSWRERIREKVKGSRPGFDISPDGGMDGRVYRVTVLLRRGQGIREVHANEWN